MFVVFVFIRDVVELTEWYDVMYIESASVFLCGFTALLAGVVVTLACASALTLPVRAIVRFMSAAPIGMVLACLKCVSAGIATKLVLKHCDPLWMTVERLTAKVTLVRRLFPYRQSITLAPALTVFDSLSPLIN